MENWIQEQASGNQDSFGVAMRTHYLNSGENVADSGSFLRRNYGECNKLDATRLLGWSAFIADGWGVAKFFDGLQCLFARESRDSCVVLVHASYA
jgi:hypothetical protein